MHGDEEMKREKYLVIDALENEEVIREFLLREADTLCLSREAWSHNRGELPTNFFKTPVNIHYGVDSDPRFMHVAKILEEDLIKRENGNYFYSISDYLKDLFNKETLFSETDSGEFAFHQHFYGFHDVILFYKGNAFIGAISSGTGDAILNLSDAQREHLEADGLTFEISVFEE